MDKIFFRLSLCGWTSAGSAWLMRNALGYTTEPPRQWDEWEYSDEFLMEYLRSERYKSHYHLFRANICWNNMDDSQRTQAKQKYQRINKEHLVLSRRFVTYHESR
uniref:Uncharacterized protein n=1 Tax=Clandestinovirus TaxID=2831644 RepID=A0A8F8PK08_9VIRU|nr:hypothetical protein KOM_12_249 [Clandestinovirus]